MFISIEHLHKSVKEEAKRITRRAEEAEKRKKSNSANSGSKPSTLSPGEPARVTDSPEPLDVAEEDNAIGGIWDLHGENPPPSSIAARKDTVRLRLPPSTGAMTSSEPCDLFSQSEARRLAKTLEEHYSRIHALAIWSEVSSPVIFRTRS